MKYIKKIKSMQVLLFAGSILLLTGFAFVLSSIIISDTQPYAAHKASDDNAIQQIIDEPVAIANVQTSSNPLESPPPTTKQNTEWSVWSQWMDADECEQKRIELENIPDDQSPYIIETQTEADSSDLMRFRWRFVYLQ